MCAPCYEYDISTLVAPIQYPRTLPLRQLTFYVLQLKRHILRFLSSEKMTCFACWCAFWKQYFMSVYLCVIPGFIYFNISICHYILFNIILTITLNYLPRVYIHIKSRNVIIWLFHLCLSNIRGAHSNWSIFFNRINIYFCLVWRVITRFSFLR